MKIQMKPLMKIIGALLSVAGLAYLFYAIDMSAVLPALGDIGGIRFVLLSLCYGGSLYIIMYVWGRFLGARQPDWPVLMPVYAQSVLAKYIPGGIFQYAARQLSLLHHPQGVTFPQSAIARASICEILLHVAAASLVSLLFLLLAGPDQLATRLSALLGTDAGVPFWHPLLAPALLGVLFVATFIPLIILSAPRLAGSMAALQIVFFVIMAWLACGMTAALLDDAPDYAYLLFVFTVSWLAGFIVIGSPGGIGVREAVIIFLLQEQVSMADAAAIALMIRLMTSAGDLFFAGSLFLLRHKNTTR